MFPAGPTMSNFTQQQWAAFAAMSNQQAIPSAQAFQVGGMDSNTLLGGVPSGYVRIAQNAQSTVLPGSSLQSTGAYIPQQTLGYALQPPMETHVGANRQFTNTTFTPPYALQQFPQVGSIPQTIPLPHTSIPYGTPFPYLQTFIPPLTGGALGHIQPCANLPSQQQTSLVAGMEPSLRSFDTIKQLGALSLEPNRRTKPMITSKTNLYISGLSETDTDETVRSLVENVVQPKSCKAMISNGICKGYGFIDCASEEDAEKAKNHIIDQARLNGRKLLVKFAHENEKDVHNVYVRHLPLDFTKEKLEALFQKFGQVTSVKLLENEDRLTGIGFVRYALAEQAEKAIEQLNAAKLVLGDNTAPVMCKLADKANTRRRPAAAHATTTLVVQPQLSMSNHLSRQAMPISNTASLPRCAIPFSQTVQPNAPFTPSIPLATQLLSPLGQPPVLIQSIQPTASPHSRSVVSPAVLPNGTPGPNPLLSMSVSSASSGTLNSHTTAVSNRTTPLIGPPPQTPASVGLQLNPNATNAMSPYLVALDNNQASPKSTATLPGFSLPPGTNYVQKDGIGACTEPITLNGPQVSCNVNQLPIKVQYSSVQIPSQQSQPPWLLGTNGSNSQLVFLTTPSIVANIPNPPAAATSLLPTYVCPPLTQTQVFNSTDLQEVTLPCENRYLKLSLPSLPSSCESDAGSDNSVTAVQKSEVESALPAIMDSDTAKCNGDIEPKEVDSVFNSVQPSTEDPKAVEKIDTVSSESPVCENSLTQCETLITPSNPVALSEPSGESLPPADKPNSLLDAHVCSTSNCTITTLISDSTSTTVSFPTTESTANNACDAVASPEHGRTDTYWPKVQSMRKKGQDSNSGALRGRRRQSDGSSHISDGRSNAQLQARGSNRRKHFFGGSLARQSSEICNDDDPSSSKQVNISSETPSNPPKSCGNPGKS